LTRLPPLPRHPPLSASRIDLLAHTLVEAAAAAIRIIAEYTLIFKY